MANRKHVAKTRMNDLNDLLRDPDDLAEVLEAYGQPIPEEPATRRQRALELAQGIPREVLLASFVRHATGFARMVQDIEAFCLSVGATVGGRVQIHMEGTSLQFEGLSSGWVLDGPSDWESAEQRALALAEELRYVTEGFDPERATDSRERLTPFGQSLQGTIFASLHLGGTTHRETTVREVDLEQLGRILDEAEDARLMLGNAELASAVASALDLAASNLRATRNALSHHARECGGGVSEELIGLRSSLSLLLSQLVALVAEVNAGRRVHKERSDFLRTELWTQRWRVYELWLLVRVLSALRHAGARVSLNGVQEGVWNLRYGRSEAPAATCDIDDTPLDVYYQLHVRSDRGADMPDIAVIGDQPILVLDPKHGRSYTRSKVQRVLTRYAEGFAATLTAIVNYYPMPAYPFEVTQQGNRRWLLASGIAPGSSGVQRLELLIRDAVLASGHIAHSESSASLSRSILARPPASTQAFLTYYTSHTVEVDELAGFWSAHAGRGPERLSALDGIIGDRPQSVDVSIASSPDVWIVKVSPSFYSKYSKEKETVWKLHEGGPPVAGDFDTSELQVPKDRGEARSPSGRYVIEQGPRSMREGVVLLRVVDTRAEAPLPLIRCHGQYANAFLWAPDESAVAFKLDQGDEKRLMMARLGDRHASPVSLPGQRPEAFGWMTAALLRSLTNHPTR